jgi:hypothetical protein
MSVSKYACAFFSSNDLIEDGVTKKILNETNKERFETMIQSKEDRCFLTVFPLRINDSEFELGDAILKALLNGKCVIGDKRISLNKFYSTSG